MTVNVKRLRKLALWIGRKDRATREDLPLKRPMPDFQMCSWAEHGDNDHSLNPKDIDICKTAGCIAGSAVALFEPHKFRKLVVYAHRNIQSEAQEILGLDHAQQRALFTPGSTGAIEARHAGKMLNWLAKHPSAGYNAITECWREILTGCPGPVVLDK